MKVISTLRELQYLELSKVTLNGSVLDLGGSKKEKYIDLIKGNHQITVVNIDDRYGYDLNFNIENKFPLEDKSYDNVITLNLIEHIFDTDNLFGEVARVIKPGGLFVSSVPYMHHIHGSPDDFHRYTKSAYLKFAEKYGFEIVYLEELGYGVFSVIFQTMIIKNWWRFPIFFNLVKFIFETLDKLLLNFKFYKSLAKQIPLRLFLDYEKKIVCKKY